MKTGPWLLRQAVTEDKKLFFQFGGQGGPWLREMSNLYRDYPELKTFFTRIFAWLDEGMAWLDLDPEEGILTRGVQLKKWLEGEELPSREYLNQCGISLVGVHICQYAYYHLLTLNGNGPASLLPRVAGMTGHSMGFHSAHLAAMGLEGDEFWRALRSFVLFVLVGGVRCQQAWPMRTPDADLVEKASALGGGVPTPMASVAGMSERDISLRLMLFNERLDPEEQVSISLRNSEDSIILSGPEEQLVDLGLRFLIEKGEELKWSWLEVTAPFHSPLLWPAWDLFEKDQEFLDYDYTGAQVQVPVYATWDGTNIQTLGDLYQYSFLLMTSTPLDWPRTVEAIDEETGLIIDFGPGRLAPVLTRNALGEACCPEILSTSRRTNLRRMLGGAP